MIDSVNLHNQLTRTLNMLFTYANTNNISFYVYKNRDFPLLNTMIDEIINNSSKFNSQLKTKKISYIKTYDKKSSLIVFVLLLNNDNLNTINYSYNDISSLTTTKIKKDIFQITMNIQYTDYHEYISTITELINDYINKKFS